MKNQWDLWLDLLFEVLIIFLIIADGRNPTISIRILMIIPEDLVAVVVMIILAFCYFDGQKYGSRVG